MDSTVRVFVSDDEVTPVALFQSGVSLKQVLATLRLSGGGLKPKGGPNVYLAEGTSGLAEGDYTVFGSAGVRYHVVLGEHRMVVPLTLTPAHKIFHLMEEVVRRFSRFNTTPGNELRIAELRSSGYLLNKYDRVADVLHDGDVIEAVDWSMWKDEQMKLCRDEWLSVTRRDFVDDSAKWCTIGRHSHNKLFLKCGEGRTTKRLELFDAEDITDFSKEGKQTVLSLKGESDNFGWHISASFVIVKGHVQKVEMEVKSCSDSRPEIRSVDITIDGGGNLAKGAVSVVQSADDEPGAVVHKVPAEVRTGPHLEIKPAPEKAPMAKLAEPFNGIKIEQIDKVDADQTWARDGVFENRFMTNFSFTNPTANAVAIIKVKSEYLSGTEWVPVESTAVGSKNGYYNYNWNWGDSEIHVYPNAVEKVAILASIPIKSAQYERNRWAHHSLSDPLKIRITFEDIQGATTSIVVENRNDVLDVYDHAKVEKRVGKKLDFYLPCDDTETEYRHYVAIAKVEEGEDERVEISMSCSSSTLYYYKWNFQKLAFTGVKENKTEVEIPDLKEDSSKGGVSVVTSALVDLKHRTVYALKFVIKTSSSSVEGYYPVPNLKSG